MCSESRMQDFTDFLYSKTKPDSGIRNQFDETQLRELRLSFDLKSLCDENGKELDTIKSSKVIHQLGRLYRQRSPDKTSLIKSGVLLNAALVRKPGNAKEIEKDIDELCSHVLNMASTRRPEMNMREKARQVKEEVETMRKMVKTELKKFNTQVQNEDNGRDNRSELTDCMEKLQKNLQRDYIDLMSGIMEYCVSTKGDTPCRYALAGMGSLARQEITPYSDFEHVILLEEDVQSRNDYEDVLEYFRWLSVMFQLVVVNMGETIIPSVCLEYLNNPFDKSYNWFYDAHTKRGISFDGMMPHASKFPLGRTATRKKPWKAELIKPVSEMLEYLGKDEDLKNGYHLADILTRTCFVAGDKDVYEQFECGVQQSIKNTMTTTQLERQIKDDLKKFNPMKTISDLKGKKEFNMKSIVFRSSTLFIAALARYHEVTFVSTFDTVKKLMIRGFVDTEFGRSLLYSVAIACEARLRVYSNRESQTDWLSVPYNQNEIAQVVKLMGIKAPVIYLETVLKLQREVCRLIGYQNVRFLLPTNTFDKLMSCHLLQMEEEALKESRRLSSIKLQQNDAIAFGKMLRLLGDDIKQTMQFSTNSYQLQRLFDSWNSVSLPLCREEVKSFLGQIREVMLNLRQSIPDLLKENKFICIETRSHGKICVIAFISLCCLVLSECVFFDNDYHHAFMCWENAHPAVERIVLLDAGHYLRTIGSILLGANIFDCALMFFEEAIGFNKQRNEQTSAGVYFGVGKCCLSVRKYDEALKMFQRGIRRCATHGERAHFENMIGRCLCEMGKYDQDLKHFENAIALRRQVDGIQEDTDFELMVFYFHTAKHYQHTKNHSEAVEFFEKSRAIAVDYINSPNAESCSFAIAMCLKEKGRFHEALNEFRAAINLRKSVFDDEKKDEKFAQYYFESGKCLIECNIFKDAISAFNEARIHWESNKDGELNTNLAKCANQIGVCFFRMKMLKPSLFNFRNALKIKMQSSGTEKSDLSLGTYYQNEGDCLFGLKNFEAAAEAYKKSSNIFRAIALHSATNKTDLR